MQGKMIFISRTQLTDPLSPAAAPASISRGRLLSTLRHGDGGEAFNRSARGDRPIETAGRLRCGTSPPLNRPRPARLRRRGISTPPYGPRPAGFLFGHTARGRQLSGPPPDGFAIQSSKITEIYRLIEYRRPSLPPWWGFVWSINLPAELLLETHIVRVGHQYSPS